MRAFAIVDVAQTQFLVESGLFRQFVKAPPALFSEPVDIAPEGVPVMFDRSLPATSLGCVPRAALFSICRSTTSRFCRSSYLGWSLGYGLLPKGPSSVVSSVVSAIAPSTIP